MAQTQNIGTVSPVPMNDWISAVSYNTLNIVRHNGASYIARSSSQGIEPGVTLGWEMYWLLLVRDGNSQELTIDAVPTKNSSNPVSSGGTYQAIRDLIDDDTLNETNAWSGSKVQQQIGSAADTLAQGMTSMGNAFSAQLNELRTTKENISNRTNFITSQCTNTQYPSAAAVYLAITVSKSTTAPGNAAGHVGSLYLVGSSDFSPFDVYICVHADDENDQYVWHKMCTTVAP